MIHRLIAAGAALGIVLPPVVLAARQIGEDASTAAQQATAAPTTNRPATTSGRAQRTPAPIFTEPLPDEPQPWSPADGPLHVGPSEPDPSPSEASPPTVVQVPPAPPEPPKLGTTEPEPADPQVELHPTAALGVAELVDRARIEAGCLPIGTDPELQRYAEEHAVAQAVAGEMAHSDGPRAENVAAGPESAAEVVEAWLTDEESRAIILDCDAVWHGVGAARGPDGVLYWTQVFSSV